MNRAIIFAIIGLLMLFVALGAVSVLAQEPTVTPAATIVPPGEDELPAEVPDLSPVIDEQQIDLEDFLNLSNFLMGAIAYVVLQAAKFFLPNTVIGTEKLYALIVVIFTAVYTLANWFGYGELLRRGVEVATVAADPILKLLSMIFVPSVLYFLARVVSNPLGAGRQGKEALSLDPPRPVLALERT